MPKIKYYDPDGKKAFQARIIANHGELVSVAELCRILGYKSYDPVHAWLKEHEVPVFMIGNRKRYETAVIADEIWEARSNG